MACKLVTTELNNNFITNKNISLSDYFLCPALKISKMITERKQLCQNGCQQRTRTSINREKEVRPLYDKYFSSGGHCVKIVGQQ